MKSTCIANGKEIVHQKPVLVPGYRTPSKAVRLAERRERFLARQARRGVEAFEGHSPELPQKARVRTLKEMAEAEERVRKQSRRGGNIYRMKNH